MSAFSYTALLTLTLPEITVAVAGLLVLALDLTVLRTAAVAVRLRAGALLACLGCLGAMLLVHSAPLASLPESMLVVTPLTHTVQIALLALAILTVLFSTGSQITGHVGEYLALLLFATVAMMFLVATENLLLIFVALEFLSLSLYVLTGFDKSSRLSAEAALKYFLFGGMSAGFLLFGMSLLYGLSGSIELPRIAAAFSGPVLDPLLLIAIVMVAIGFGFKVAAAPFHLWAPDAYQGAPTVSAGFIASSSKVASFFLFAQVVTVGLATATGAGAGGRGSAPGWVPVLAIVAAVSMVVGNLAAIAQTSVRRLLAYSAIGHAGYMLLGMVAHTPQGLSALLYYVITYALAALGAFGVLGALEAEGIDSLADLAGLYRRAPGLSLCLLIFLLSLAGIPPLAGFFGKFYLFASALYAEPHLGLLWLVLLAVAMSAVSLYYYLRVLKQVYVAEPAADAGAIRVGLVTRVTLWVVAGLVILLGCAPGLLLGWLGVQ